MTEVMLKIAGAACVMGAAITYGEQRARALDARVRQLQQFQRSLKLLSTEVSYAHAVLPLAFETVSRRCGSPVAEIYSTAAELLLSGQELTPGEAWKEAVGKKLAQTNLTPSDREIIESLGISLGVSEQEGQLKQIQLTGQHLDFALEVAQEEKGRHGKLWRYLGFIGGAALVILLL